MPNGLALVLQRVERAKEQRRDLEVEIRAWEGGAYKIGRQPNLETGYTHFYLGEAGEISPLIEALISEIIHALRTALDHLAYQLFLVSRNNPADDGSKIKFPIYDDTAQTTEAKAFRPIESFRKDIIEAIRAVNPCKSGNPLLWSLHRLDIVDKHRRIVTSHLVHHSVYVRDALRQLLIERGIGDMADAVLELRGAFFTPPKSGKRAQVGDVIFAVPSETSEEMQQKLKFTFDITFEEPGIIEGKSVIETLGEMLKVVENLVLSFAPFLV